MNRIWGVLLFVLASSVQAAPPAPAPWEWRFTPVGMNLSAYGCATGSLFTWAQIKACFVQHVDYTTAGYDDQVQVSGSPPTYYPMTTGPTGEPGAGVVGNTMYICNSAFACSSGSIGLNRACPVGYSDVGGVCTPACVSDAGKEADTEVSWIGAESDPNPATTCIGACVANFMSGSRFDITTGDGTRYNSFKGIAKLSGEGCGGSDKPGSLLGAARVVDAGAGTADGTGIGGVGTGRGAASGFQTADGINLARVATNTARLADALAGGAGGTGGSGSAGGSCGGTGQPVCQTSSDVDGSGAPDAAAVGLASVSSMTSQNQSELNTAAAQLNVGTAPNMGGSGSWWQPSLAPFIGATSACTHTWAVVLPQMASQNWTLDVCEWAPYLQAFLYWAFGIWTMWGLWSIVYAPRRV